MRFLLLFFQHVFLQTPVSHMLMEIISFKQRILSSVSTFPFSYLYANGTQINEQGMHSPYFTCIMINWFVWLLVVTPKSCLLRYLYSPPYFPNLVSLRFPSTLSCDIFRHWILLVTYLSLEFYHIVISTLNSICHLHNVPSRLNFLVDSERYKEQCLLESLCSFVFPR